jgi:endonuclease-3
MPAKTDWTIAIRPLLKKYKGKRHPLEYNNVYQLVVMVILSAQSTDDYINKVAPAFFKTFRNMQVLSKSTPEGLFPYLKGIRNFAHKAKWLTEIAQKLKKDSNIPLTLEALTDLPGIGRKSANVILREAGKPAEGIIVDLHVVRVAERLGLTSDTDPKKIEQDLMEKLPESQWDVGMALSFLGREICRPKPLHEICPMKSVCAYYKKGKAT